MTETIDLEAKLKAEFFTRPSAFEMVMGIAGIGFVILPAMLPNAAPPLQRVALALTGALTIALVTAHAVLRRTVDMLGILEHQLLDDDQPARN